MQYEIYGIGNALVDYEIEVQDTDLDSLNIAKGRMILVDEERQRILMEHVKGIAHKRACGGSVANSIITAAKYGAKNFMVCRVASDEAGAFYSENLKEEGVDSSFDYVDRREGVTGKALIFITPDAERSMQSYLGISEGLSTDELIEESLRKSKYFFMEGYLSTSDSGRQAAIKGRKIAEENNVKTVITLSDPSMTEFFHAQLTEMIGDGVDLLFCNREEAQIFTKTEDIEAAMDELKKIAKQIVITRGAEGAIAFDGKNMHDIEGVKVKAVDTNGAGDTFAGSFLYALTQEKDFAIAGKFASFSSAQLVTQFGPRLKDNTLAKVMEFYSQL